MKINKIHFSFVSISMAFFMWGLLTSLNDILIPHLKLRFTLTYTEAMLVQFVFFMTYAVLSIPLSRLLHLLGYRWTVVVGFFIAGIGCLGFWPAAGYRVYAYFLISLVVLAAGIVVLQVAANPYVSLLGNKKEASARLTFVQGLNSLGTTIGPIIGGIFILGAIAVAGENTLEAVRAIQIPYLILAIIMFALCLYFIIFPLAQLENDAEHDQQQHNADETKSIWKYKHLVYGCIAIFAYVGAEVTIGSFLVNYFGSDHVLNLEPRYAAKYVAFYWGGAMVGRLIGSLLLTKIHPPKAICFNAVVAIILVLVSILSDNHIAMWSILAVGLFNSILFPSIFSLSVRELGTKTSLGSGLLCVSIVGGAIIPLLQGVFADHVGLTLSFIIPIICYLYIFFFGAYGYDSSVSIE
ncbi:sugar MFS transporter [Thiotrichales bacterium 19S3-7]|nr:sugar MFS transporter [Thiotrichales bacterium 19S3-7]MCF6800912.1 sugar MFS transporter [Thiotrichales bacterium 19S3-11]